MDVLARMPIIASKIGKSEKSRLWSVTHENCIEFCVDFKSAHRVNHFPIAKKFILVIAYVLNAWAECYTQANRNNEVRIPLFTG